MNAGLRTQGRRLGALWPNLDEGDTHVTQQPQGDHTSPATNKLSYPAEQTSVPPTKPSYLRSQQVIQARALAVRPPTAMQLELRQGLSMTLPKEP